MKVSDYIVRFWEDHGVTVVFGYQGSSIAHTIDSISKSEKLNYVQLLHEQAVSFAANGHAELGKKMGVAIACSGPGAINLMTGIANAFYDSNRCMFLTGQVSTFEMKNDKKIRQMGFQETDIVSMVKGITKYAVTITRPDDIAFQLEKALYIMNEGRWGPVLLDIPHNVQNAMIDESNLEHFVEPFLKNIEADLAKIKESADILRHSKRPVILLGGGAKEIRLDSNIGKRLSEIGVPVITSYRGKDTYDNFADNYFGVVGTYGNRYANYLVKYCDALLIVGSRIDGRQTGNDIANFASQAQIIYVDIDEEEISEKATKVLPIYCKANEYLQKLLEILGDYKVSAQWTNAAGKWRTRYRDYHEYKLKDGANPNYLLHRLTALLNGQYIMSVDVGQNQIWANASSIISKGYLLQSCGLGTMGYAIPAIIGAFFGHHNLPLICVCGDGGFQMNIQELQTILEYQIPVKIFVLNNASLGLIRVYQQKALNANYIGSVNGFNTPNCEKLAQVYNMKYCKIENNDFEEMLKEIVCEKNACLIEVCINELSTCFPEPTYNSEFTNQSPELSLEEKSRIQEEAYGAE